MAWGLEAKNSGPLAGTTLCEWFKLFLEPSALRDESSIDPRLPTIPVSGFIGEHSTEQHPDCTLLPGW